MIEGDDVLAASFPSEVHREAAAGPCTPGNDPFVVPQFPRDIVVSRVRDFETVNRR